MTPTLTLTEFYAFLVRRKIPYVFLSNTGAKGSQGTQTKRTLTLTLALALALALTLTLTLTLTRARNP